MLLADMFLLAHSRGRVPTASVGGGQGPVDMAASATNAGIFWPDALAINILAIARGVIAGHTKGIYLWGGPPRKLVGGHVNV